MSNKRDVDPAPLDRLVSRSLTDAERDDLLLALVVQVRDMNQLLVDVGRTVVALCDRTGVAIRMERYKVIAQFTGLLNRVPVVLPGLGDFLRSAERQKPSAILELPATSLEVLERDQYESESLRDSRGRLREELWFSSVP